MKYPKRATPNASQTHRPRDDHHDSTLPPITAATSWADTSTVITSTGNMAKLPALFISHGAPTLALEQSATTSALARIGQNLPKPRAIVIMSAHWQSAKLEISIIDKLGGSAGEVGRMTRDIISSSSYIEGLNHYINNDSHSVEARDVAKEHLADTLDKTCQQFKLALRDVNSLPTTQRKTYSEALKATLETFTEQYGKELPERQHKALQDGLESYQYQVSRTNTPSRGFRP